MNEIVDFSWNTTHNFICFFQIICFVIATFQKLFNQETISGYSLYWLNQKTSDFVVDFEPMFLSNPGEKRNSFRRGKHIILLLFIHTIFCVEFVEQINPNRERSSHRFRLIFVFYQFRKKFAEIIKLVLLLGN